MSEPAVSHDRANDITESWFCICCMAMARGADLVIAVEVECIAGEVAGGNGVGAFGDQGDCSGDATRGQEREAAADESAENSREPQSKECDMVGAAKLREFGVGLGHLGLSQIARVREE